MVRRSLLLSMDRRLVKVWVNWMHSSHRHVGRDQRTDKGIWCLEINWRGGRHQTLERRELVRWLDLVAWIHWPLSLMELHRRSLMELHRRTLMELHRRTLVDLWRRTLVDLRRRTLMNL